MDVEAIERDVRRDAGEIALRARRVAEREDGAFLVGAGLELDERDAPAARRRRRLQRGRDIWLTQLGEMRGGRRRHPLACAREICVPLGPHGDDEVATALR